MFIWYRTTIIVAFFGAEGGGEDGEHWKDFLEGTKPLTLIFLVEHFFFNCSSQATRRDIIKNSFSICLVSFFAHCKTQNIRAGFISACKTLLLDLYIA